MKPKLKLPGTKRFKLKCGIMLSTSALKSDLRRCIQEKALGAEHQAGPPKPGAYTRSR